CNDGRRSLSGGAVIAVADLQQVRAFIDRHYAKPLTVERLGRAAGVSPSSFIRAFRAVHGETPHQYVRTRRIERAKELLVTPPLPITEICDPVGLQSFASSRH